MGLIRINFFANEKSKLFFFSEITITFCALCLIIFNANVLMSDVGKVWHGDLNLTEDYLVLKDIAKSLNTTLYVLWESDGRFGEENKPLTALLDKAVWSTDDTKPTKEWYLNKQKTK